MRNFDTIKHKKKAKNKNAFFQFVIFKCIFLYIFLIVDSIVQVNH